MIVLYIIYALIGIGIIIFIHEAGHFLAAKKVGVRVERFAVGFDPSIRGRPLRLCAFKRGETEYIVGLIPFGGYVKMAGETLIAGDGEGAPDELTSKSVGARALVFAAGAIMNILSAILFFILAFTLGVSFVESEIGGTVKGGPAWKAGLMPADKVVSIDGEPIVDYTELRISEATADGPLQIVYERDGETRSTTVTPKFNAIQGIQEIGVTPPISPIVAEPPAESPAAKAGVRTGDRIVGLKVSDLEFPELAVRGLLDVVHELHLVQQQPIELGIERDGQRLWLSMPARVLAEGEPIPGIGVNLSSPFGSGNAVRALRPGSAAAQAGLLRPGDLVREVNGEPIHNVTWMEISRRIKDQQENLTLTVLSTDDSREVVVSSRDLLAWVLSGDIAWSMYSTRVGPVDSDTSLQSEDRIVSVGDQPCFTPAELKDLVSSRTGSEELIRVLRDDEIVTQTISHAALESLAKNAKMAFQPIYGVIRGGPAEKVGIEAGATILALGGQPVESWSGLQEAAQTQPVGTSVSVRWLTAAGEEREGELNTGFQLLDPFGIRPSDLKKTLVKVGVLEACQVGFARTIVVGEWVFLTLRSLIKREVSAKNLTGPVGITHLLTKISEQKSLGTLLYFLALISVNLGLLNLMPFPVLDGGHLLFLLIELVKGKPVDVRIQEWATNIAFFLILALAIFVTVNDVARLFQ